MKHFSRTAAFVSLAVFASVAEPAWADVKIVSTVSVTGQAPRPGGPLGRGPAYPHTVTAYFQGANSRTEVAGGMVVLYTGQDGKTTVLDPVRKTYFVRSAAPGGPGTMSATADLKPASGTQTLAGSAARRFLLSGSLKMNAGGPPPPGSSRRPGMDDFGGPPPPGGFGGPPPQNGFDGPPPGGGPGGGDRRGRRPPMAQASVVSGEMWLSSTIKLPSSAKEALMPLLREAVPGAGPLVMLVASSVAQTHELPLLAKITLTPSAPPPVLAGERAFPTDAPKPVPTVATLTVTSVSTSALNPALFAVPQGYALTSPPRGPGRRPEMAPGDRGQNPGMPGGPPPPGMGMNDGPPPPGGDFGGPPPPGDEINTAPLPPGQDMNTAPQSGGGMETAPQSGGGMNTAPLPPDASMDPAAP